MAGSKAFSSVQFGSVHSLKEADHGTVTLSSCDCGFVGPRLGSGKANGGSGYGCEGPFTRRGVGRE
jgi:hypothetical protein